MVSTFEPFLNEMFEQTFDLLCDRALYILRFARFDVRMEGWLQEELLNLLLDAARSGRAWKVEGINKDVSQEGVSQTGGRPDFALRVRDVPFTLEVKVLSARRGLRSILRRDVPKLKKAGTAGALLLLAYRLGPSEEPWLTVAKWQRLADDLKKGSGLECLLFRPIKTKVHGNIAEIGALSLWRTPLTMTRMP